MKCQICKYNNRPSAVFCLNCGNRLTKKNEDPSSDSTFEITPQKSPESKIEIPVSSAEVKPRRPIHYSNTKKGPKIIAICIVIMIVVISYYWLNKESSSTNKRNLWDPGFDVENLITDEDKLFYEQYPHAPMIYKLTKNTITQTPDILFEQQAIYGEDLPIFSQLVDKKVALYDWVIETAQVTPSIRNLAQRILQDVNDDRVEKANVIFNFVSHYLQYSLDGEYEFPVTTLLEREGQCSEFATLLTSLYMATGFKTNYVLTSMGSSEYYEMYHIWVALYLPEFKPTDPAQDLVVSSLGEGWIGLDTTGNQCLFGELYGALDYHSNIVSIIEPVTCITIYDLEAKWDSRNKEDQQCVHLDIYLKTWDSNNNFINLTFRLYEDNEVSDMVNYSFNKNTENKIGIDLTYFDIGWDGRGRQYITISVEN